MSGVSIVYGDIAPNAKEDFVASVTSKADFVRLSQLQKNNLDFKNYANPCELYQTVLDSSQEIFPENPKNVYTGIWSGTTGDSNGSFSTPIVLTLQSRGQYSSIGLTLTFDTDNNIFCNNLNIKWYRDNILLSDVDFSPDNAKYFCENTVEYYNKIIITFNSMNMPYNRLKLRTIDYGYGTTFYGDELSSVKLLQEINPISESIVSNTCDFVLNSKSNINYTFQSTQPLLIFFDERLKASAFIDKAKRTGKRNWTISAYDYIGLFDDMKYMGGMFTDKNAAELIGDILTEAKAPYEIDESLLTETVTGYIPICTIRQALQMICFAIGAVANTAYSDKIKIFPLQNEVTQSITKNNIRRYPSFENTDKVTEIQISKYRYDRGTPDQTLYEASKDGTGKNIRVEFSEPHFDLFIKNGKIISSGVNYAYIDANEDCILTGQKYYVGKKIISKKNPNITATTKENIVVIDNQTLISEKNADKILELCYKYYIKNHKTTASIDSGHDGVRRIRYGEVKYGTERYGEIIQTDERIELGETISIETDYMGDIAGQVTRQAYNLNGNIIVKECEMIW